MSEETTDLGALEPDVQGKTLNVKNVEEAKAVINDIEVFGNGDLWQLLCKASSKSQGWMKSTKAMEVYNGCLVQVTTQQGDQIAEAVTFVQGVGIGRDQNGNPVLKSKLELSGK